jgi:VanZ family protein
MRKLLRSLLLVTSLAVILFFALKANPEVPKAMAPLKARIFFNTFDAFRNQLAFALFGIATLLLLMGRSFWNRKQLVAVSLIALLIPLLEVLQIWMPQRHADVGDVLNGWLGLGLACIVYLVVRWLWRIATGRREKTDLATRRGRY